MNKLAAPSVEQAQRALGEVEFIHRLMGCRLHRRLGVIPVPIYSLKDAAALLLEPLAQLDLEALGAWIEEHFKYVELAGRVREIALAGGSPALRSSAAGEALAIRLQQCLQII